MKYTVGGGNTIKYCINIDLSLKVDNQILIFFNDRVAMKIDLKVFQKKNLPKR